ncbi:WD40-repeat-containing domain protein [Pisolithus croceorrhizus]|nr:WD40-repeat-containing domain protein [Pisolithus croceorrhizus]KAI6127944.1 WD40-repeat-containing domain protein [Pisolithus croceorrhizus]
MDLSKADTQMDVDPQFSLQLVSSLPGHEERAWQVAWNPAKPLLASCSADKTVRLYSYQRSAEDQEKSPSFSHISTISTAHTKTVRSIAWAPSGKTLATGSFDSNVGIYEKKQEFDDENDLDESEEWECVAVLEGHETECKSVAYSATGTLLASCSRDKTVWIWEVQPDADFECMGVLMEHSQDVKCVAWHPTEEILASASYDDTIKLYIDDPSEDWYCVSTLTGHESTIWSLAWSPDGNYLASASDDLSIRIWKRVDQYDWKSVHQIKGHERSIYSISWNVGKGTSPKSMGWLASTGGDGKINVWEISSMKETLSSKLIASVSSAHDVSDVNSVQWCPRPGFEDLLATAGDDGSVKVWRVMPASSS